LDTKIKLKKWYVDKNKKTFGMKRREIYFWIQDTDTVGSSTKA
jgi:hypothetical protein